MSWSSFAWKDSYTYTDAQFDHKHCHHVLISYGSPLLTQSATCLTTDFSFSNAHFLFYVQASIISSVCFQKAKLPQMHQKFFRFCKNKSKTRSMLCHSWSDTLNTLVVYVCVCQLRSSICHISLIHTENNLRYTCLKLFLCTTKCLASNSSCNELKTEATTATHIHCTIRTQKLRELLALAMLTELCTLSLLH